MQNKTIIEIPAGGFYVYNPKKQPDVIPTSDGAFGCCYLTIKDGDNILVAHINATSIMLDSVAKQTVQKMLTAFKNAGGKIENAETTIIHSNDPQEYEMGFQNRPSDLTREQKKPRGHYSEKFDENDFSLFVAEPFAHFALQKALVDAGVKDIKFNAKFNTNLGEFMKNPDVKPIKTDIVIGRDGETYLRNFDNNTGFAKFSENGAEKVFNQLKTLVNHKVLTPSWGETPPVGKFYANLAKDIKDEFISVENSIGAAKEGSKDYSQFAAMDMNKYIESKLAPQKEPIQTSLTQKTPSYQKSTISSVMKMSNTKKIEKPFVGAKKQQTTQKNVPNK